MAGFRRSKDLGTTGISMPSGVVISFAGTTAPSGWLLCFGQQVAIADYPELYGVLGTTYGALTNGSGGTGSTHFVLPDMRGRAVAGKDDMGGSAASRLTAGGAGITGTTLGASGGVESVTLTSAQSGVPAHSHANTLSDPGHNHTQNAHTHTQNAHEHEVIARGTLGGNRKFYGDYNGGAGSTHFNPNSIGTITGPLFSNPMVGEAVTATNQNTTATNIANTTGITITNVNNTTANAASAHSNTQPTIVLNYIIKV